MMNALRERPRRVVIVGSSSGIGRALAKRYDREGFEIGLCGRNPASLESLQQELKSCTHVKALDLKDPREAMKRLRELLEAMRQVDIIIINSGVNHTNPALLWENEQEIINVNVLGFAAAANVAAHYFMSRKIGHLVAVSSIASIRGAPRTPAYPASKAFMVNYLEGLRYKLCRYGVDVTDIRPGFVDTAMIAGRRNLFWVASPQAAAQQIYHAVQRRRKVAYVTRRWALLALIYRFVPGWFLARAHRQLKEDEQVRES